MSWHYYLLSAIFAVAGIFHFIKPKAFTRVMPLYLPYPTALVYISGLLEIAVAIGLWFDDYQKISLWMIIFMLIAFFPVHIHMLVHKKAGLNLPKGILIGRLLLQFGLIFWAYSYL